MAVGGAKGLGKFISAIRSSTYKCSMKADKSVYETVHKTCRFPADLNVEVRHMSQGIGYVTNSIWVGRRVLMTSAFIDGRWLRSD